MSFEARGLAFLIFVDYPSARTLSFNLFPNMKKTSSLIGAAALLLVLAGCTNPMQKSEETTMPAPAVEAPVVTPAPVAPEAAMPVAPEASTGAEATPVAPAMPEAPAAQ